MWLLSIAFQVQDITKLHLVDITKLSLPPNLCTERSEVPIGQLPKVEVHIIFLLLFFRDELKNTNWTLSHNTQQVGITMKNKGMNEKQPIFKI
jgi:hypothetical protein